MYLLTGLHTSGSPGQRSGNWKCSPTGITLRCDGPRARAGTVEGEGGKDQCFKGLNPWRAGDSDAPAFWAHQVEKPGILTRGLLLFPLPHCPTKQKALR